MSCSQAIAVLTTDLYSKKQQQRLCHYKQRELKQQQNKYKIVIFISSTDVFNSERFLPFSRQVSDEASDFFTLPMGSACFFF